MTRRVRKAVFPVAGLGTRFLPATKLVAKEMLPVVDKPLIQYAVEEAFAAGIEYCMFITGRGKAVLVDHFDSAPELEAMLRDRGKQEPLAELLGGRPKAGTILATRQQAPLGLGHAVSCARAFTDDEPFAVILPDDLILSDRPCLSQLIDVWSEHGGNVIAVEEVDRSRTANYGILDVAADDGRVARAQGLVEKPQPDVAPSRLAIIGRYVLDPKVMRALESTAPGAGGEIQLTDAIRATLPDVAIHGLRFDGMRFDCGDKVGFIEANLAFALERPDIRPRLVQSLKATVAALEAEEDRTGMAQRTSTAVDAAS